MAILIKDPERCPNCAAFKSLLWDQRKCGECGERIFRPSDDFVKIAHDVILSFWVYFPLNSSGYFRGWVHAAHLKNHNPNAANIYSSVREPDKGYGMKKRHPLANDPIPLQVIS
jgi:hypothetical protein